MNHELRSSIVNIQVPQPDEVVKRLEAQNIFVDARVGGIRVAPFFYNTKNEINILFSALDTIL